jgi:pimeloyl-ACP methyl ester carboxylesterase
MASPQKSTNGRSFVPWPLRAGLAALSAVSPALAARAGERLFLTPPRPDAPAREREALAAWRRFEVAGRHGRLAAWRTGVGPAVVLVHGWGGRGGQLAPFAPALVEAGCSVVTFDAPGHGASPGRIASVVHFADALEDVARAVHGRAAVGHSVGGAALGYALSRGLPLAAGVAVGAPRSPARFLQGFGAALGLDPAALGRVRARVEARVGVAMDALDVARVAPRDDAVPLLVLHDRADVEVPFADGEAIADAWPGARLQATDGLGHRRILRDARTIAAAVEFVVARLPRCGCGRLAWTRACGTADGEARCAGCVVAEELWDRGGRRARVG